MKKIKRLSAFVLTLIMLFSMSLSAFADTTPVPSGEGEQETYSLFITNDAENHVYEAYQVFSGDLSSDKTTLSNIEWGTAIKDAKNLLDALLNDTKEIKLANDATTTLRNEFAKLNTDTYENYTPEEMAREVATILSGIANDSAILDRFAELVGEVEYDPATGVFQSHKYFENPTGTSGPKTVQDGVNGYLIENLPAGYYLIKDKDTGNGASTNLGDFYTQYIIRVVKSDTLKVKGQGVSVEKTVHEAIDGTFGDIESVRINETIYFKLVGSLPSNLSSYDTYHYEFIDTMYKGIKFDAIEQIYIENSSDTVATTLYDKEKDKGTLPKGMKLTVSENETTADGNTVINIEFEDLFSLYPFIIPSQKIVVKYSAHLTRDALISDANFNEVVLKYDNNPNGQGTGTTVVDNAYVFTFEVNIDKYDSADTAKKLKDVEFILYYQETVGEDLVRHYAQVVTEEMVEAGVVINDIAVVNEDVGIVYGFTKDRSQASVLDTDENGKISLRGLNEGLYYLEETKTNDGYNLLDTPVQIEITPTYTLNEDDCDVEVKYKVDGREQGTSHTVGVRNSKGSVLPSTGGIGTTIFYVVGGVLAVGAVVILVTKKRMSNEK